MITTDIGIRQQTAESLYQRFPVVVALVRISKRTIGTMIDNIENAQDRKTRQLSAKVIRYVEGNDLAKCYCNCIWISKQTKSKKQIYSRHNNLLQHKIFIVALINLDGNRF